MLSHITSDLMGQNCEEISHSRKCGSLTFPWKDYCYKSRKSSLARSINQTKWDWLHWNLISINRSRDIAIIYNLKKIVISDHLLINFAFLLHINFIHLWWYKMFVTWSKFINYLVSNYQNIFETNFIHFILFHTISYYFILFHAFMIFYTRMYRLDLQFTLNYGDPGNKITVHPA
jgi:hypothetical protein